MITMQILVNTDNHIEGSEGLTSHVQSIVEDALARFGNRVTRIEVQLTDEKARVAGLQPIAVSQLAATIDQAIDGALDKLEKTLDRTLEKRDDPKGRPSFSGE
jgi:ribosome-associated translation inhibitor RaiA